MAVAGELASWARDYAVSLQSLDWRTGIDAAVESLRERLDGKRIVFLGEPDHYVAERIDHRLVMIRLLATMGFDWLLAERGFSDGSRIDRFMADGSLETLRSASCLLDPSDSRRRSSDPFVGRWPADWVERHRNEEAWFYSQLRDLRSQLGFRDPFRFVGFDVDLVPGGGFDDLASVQELWREHPAVGPWLEAIRAGSGESNAQTALRLEGLLQEGLRREAEFSSVLGESWLFVRESLHSLRDSFDVHAELDRQRRDPDAVRMYHKLGERELAMLRKVRWVLEEVDPDSRVILMGHNEHLALSREALSLRTREESPIPPKKVLGAEIRALYGEQVFASWLLVGGGQHFSHPMDPNPKLTIPPGEGRLELQLSQAVPGDFVLPLGSQDPRSRALDERWDHWTGGADHSFVPRSACDSILFVQSSNEPRVRGR